MRYFKPCNIIFILLWVFSFRAMAGLGDGNESDNYFSSGSYNSGHGEGYFNVQVGPPTPIDPNVPFDGGVLILLAGLAIGGMRLIKKNNLNE